MLATALPAPQARAGDISQRVERAVAGDLGEEAERDLFGDLAGLSVQVADRYDQWVKSGAGESRSAANSLAAALLPALERLHAYHQGRIDKAQNRIIAEDGNPEVLYKEHWWQVDRGFVLAAAGQLSWLHYRLAMLNPEQTDKRKAWLQKSVREFSQFIAAADDKVRLESTLGRAMAEGELGEREYAEADLQAVLDAGRASPLYWPARLSLGQLRAGAGGDAALAETRKLLAEVQGAGVGADTVNQVRMLRLDALVKNPGEGTEKEAAGIVAQLSAAGPAASRRASQIVLAHMKDPRSVLGASASSEWIAAENLASEEKFAQAAKAYEAILGSTDAAAREHATEVHHRLGVCYFRLGRFADAERELRTYLGLAPDGPLAPEAAYLQLRAAEGVYRAEPSPEVLGTFSAAVENFVKKFPQHPSRYEGLFRYGELLQNARRFTEAADAYEQVRGPAVFELRAAAASVQCLADAIWNRPDDADKEWAQPIRARLAADYQRFDELAAANARLAVADLRARTVFANAMGQAVGPGAQPADALATLEGFERRFPDARELHVPAAALRLAAAAGLERYDDAERGVAALASLSFKDPISLDILERLARVLLRVSAWAGDTDPGAGRRWAALAGTALDRLKKEGRPIPQDARLNLAQIWVEQGRFDEAAALYAELVAASPGSRTVLRAAAMLADQRSDAAASAEYWSRLATMQEVASPAWYEARLAAANAMFASGHADQACSAVKEVDEFRPDLRDATTRQRFGGLAARACGAGGR
ncbi:MAG: tetratricopeptide repeat protein [Deltaproteobacteria bacterium]|nr:tetratricopeptide repeat protein [Deltaproteobacteria bacterium]